MLRLSALSLILFLPPLAFPQTPVFEAASIKPGTRVPDPPDSRWKSTGTRLTEDPGRITYQYVTLMQVLMRAYDVKKRQISGPAWLDTETYDIVATFPAGASKEQLPAMLQNLLAERFKMAEHAEDRQERVYSLTAGKNPRFKESSEAGASVSFDREGHMQFVDYTMTAFADVLTRLLNRSVIDSTGLPGHYDISTHLAMDSTTADSADPAPSIFTAMQELGLKLEAGPGPVKYIVVDKADKVPTAN